MIQFDELRIEDKEKYDILLKECNYRACDYTFGNLYIWRKKSGLQAAFYEGCLLLRFKRESCDYYLFPAGDGDKKKALEAMARDSYKRGSPLTMAGVTMGMRDELEKMAPGRFEYIEDRNSYDYIYESRDLMYLEGKKYHSKRNHISRFKTFGEWSYEDLDASNLAECSELSRIWCIENNCATDSGLMSEYCAVKEALGNFEALGFVGGVLRQMGKVVAFTVGEPLCDDTFVVHIEKALSSVEGAYPMINNEFVLHRCEGYRYVNREEDAGDEGLRRAKLSYKPSILLEKDIARLRGGETL